MDDLRLVVDKLAEPGEFLALSPGDPSWTISASPPPVLAGSTSRAAAFRHALVDAAHYRDPFPNCWCWRDLPRDVAAAMEHAYRSELARACPATLDDRRFASEMTVAMAAWPVWTLHRRLPPQRTATTRDGASSWHSAASLPRPPDPPTCHNSAPHSGFRLYWLSSLPDGPPRPSRPIPPSAVRSSNSSDDHPSGMAPHGLPPMFARAAGAPKLTRRRVNLQVPPTWKVACRMPFDVHRHRLVLAHRRRGGHQPGQCMPVTPDSRPHSNRLRRRRRRDGFRSRSAHLGHCWHLDLAAPIPHCYPGPGSADFASARARWDLPRWLGLRQGRSGHSCGAGPAVVVSVALIMVCQARRRSFGWYLVVVPFS